MYNWELWDPRDDTYLQDIEYVPMVRTASDASEVAGYFSGSYETTPTALLGFNEPDLSSQADMTYESAAQLWVEYIMPIRETYGVKLGAPVVTNSDSGKEWFANWVSYCESEYGGCTYDFIPLHWYSSDFSYFESYVQSWLDSYSAPLWITEMAFTRWDESDPPTDSEVQEFMAEALPYLDGLSRVERYSWFGPFEVSEDVGVANSLVLDDALTALGTEYIG